MFVFHECKSVFLLSQTLKSLVPDKGSVRVCIPTYTCMHLCKCMHVCAHTVSLVWVRAGLMAPVVCQGPWGGERRGVLQAGGCHGRLVRRRWRIKVSLGFFYGGLAFNITTAEGHPCTLFKIQHKRMKHWPNWDEKAKHALVLEVSTNNITSEAHKLM